MTRASPLASRPDDDHPRAELSRRELLALAGGLTLAAAGAGCRSSPAPAAAPGLADPIHYSSAGALAEAIARKRVSSEEVTRAFLDRIAAVNDRLNAVVRLDGEGALTRARALDAELAAGRRAGPLHGVPMTIKDSLDTAGIVSTGGTTGRRAFVPAADATVVERLRTAGAVLLGKTNTPELTLSFETVNLIHGKTSNPFDLTRTSGGSSGGAAAIVAAGGAAFDIGSDYGGSIRVPAHFCGVAGLKPTAGRVPRTGHIYPFGGLQDGFQQIGPIARTVDDLTLLLPIIMGPDFVDPGVTPLPWTSPDETALAGLRVAFHTDNGVATPTADIVGTVRAVADALGAARAVVTEARPTGVERVMEVGVPLYFWDGGATIRRLLAEAGTTETTLGGFARGPSQTAERIEGQIHALDLWRSGMLRFFKDYDVILCPVSATPALPHGEASSDRAFPMFSYTFSYNLTGWPGVVVRAGTSGGGLPIGVQILAHPGREDVALAVARFVETARGGFQRPAI